MRARVCVCVFVRASVFVRVRVRASVFVRVCVTVCLQNALQSPDLNQIICDQSMQPGITPKRVIDTLVHSMMRVSVTLCYGKPKGSELRYR